MFPHTSRRAFRLLAGVLVVAALLAARWSLALETGIDPPETVLASGSLAHHRLTNALFHIDALWFRVQPRTDLHRWFLQGAGQHAVVLLTKNPGRFGDTRNIKIFTGTAVHGLDPSRVPMVHTLSILDRDSGKLGPIAFETRDMVLVAKFAPHDNVEISLVVMLLEVD